MSHSSNDQSRFAAASAFMNHGLLFGSLLGVLVGALIAGPKFGEWPASEILAAFAICAVVCGITGYFAVYFWPLESDLGGLSRDDPEDDPQLACVDGGGDD